MVPALKGVSQHPAITRAEHSIHLYVGSMPGECWVVVGSGVLLEGFQYLKLELNVGLGCWPIGGDCFYEGLSLSAFSVNISTRKEASFLISHHSFE